MTAAAVGAEAPGTRPPALLVVNARSRRGGEVAERAAEALRAAGVPVLPRESRERESLSDLIRRARGEVGSVILGGGDGTLHAAAPALRETGLPLGILPLGTANLFAHNLGLRTRHLRAAIRRYAVNVNQAITQLNATGQGPAWLSEAVQVTTRAV